MAKTRTSFKKGVSGNPRGRPPGTGRIDEYRRLLEPVVPEILKNLAGQAKDGNLLAARMVLERVYPVRDAVLADILADLDELRSPIDARKSREQETEMAGLLREVEDLRRQVKERGIQ